MQKEQKTDTKEFKVEAVRLLETSEKSQSQIARELGVADSTLSNVGARILQPMATMPFPGAATRCHWKKKIGI